MDPLPTTSTLTPLTSAQEADRLYSDTRPCWSQIIHHLSEYTITKYGKQANLLYYRESMYAQHLHCSQNYFLFLSRGKKKTHVIIFQDKEPPVLPSPTSLALPGQTGSSSGDFDPLHLHQEEEAERGQRLTCTEKLLLLFSSPKCP